MVGKSITTNFPPFSFLLYVVTNQTENKRFTNLYGASAWGSSTDYSLWTTRSRQPAPLLLKPAAKCETARGSAPRRLRGRRGRSSPARRFPAKGNWEKKGRFDSGTRSRAEIHRKAAEIDLTAEEREGIGFRRSRRRSPFGFAFCSICFAVSVFIYMERSGAPAQNDFLNQRCGSLFYIFFFLLFFGIFFQLDLKFNQ